MEQTRWTLPPLSQPGQVITFYAYDGAPSLRHSLVLAGALLSDRAPWPAPVLLVDFDVHAPSLTRLLGADEQRPGLLELMAECARALADRGHPLRPHGVSHDVHPSPLASPASQCGEPGPGGGAALAREVLDNIDWARYIQRADPTRPLYVMGAGRQDTTFGERAHTLDWDGLFHACPALFRELSAHLARRFGYVLIAAPRGRSAPVSLATALLTDRLVGLFHPDPASLEGLCGTVERAIDYRCSHEDEQRPLLVYPVPLGAVPAGLRPDSNRAAIRTRLERLISYCYGLRSLSLAPWLSEISLPSNVQASAAELLAAPGQAADRASLTRQLGLLLDWVEPGRFPWQSPQELDALRALESATDFTTRQPGLFANGLLARAQAELGSQYLRAGRRLWAQQYLNDSLALRESLFGADSAETLDSVARLAEWARICGHPSDLPGLTERLLAGQRRAWGAEHPYAFEAWLAHVQALAGAGDAAHASAVLSELLRLAIPVLGPHHAIVLDAQQAEGELMLAQGEEGPGRAMLEHVLSIREQVFGPAHAATCALQRRLNRHMLDGEQPGSTVLDGVRYGEAADAQGPAEPPFRCAEAGCNATPAATGLLEPVPSSPSSPPSHSPTPQPGLGPLPAPARVGGRERRSAGTARAHNPMAERQRGARPKLSPIPSRRLLDVLEIGEPADSASGRQPKHRMRPEASADDTDLDCEPACRREGFTESNSQLGPPGETPLAGSIQASSLAYDPIPEGGLRLVGFGHRLSGTQAPMPAGLLPCDPCDQNGPDGAGLAQRIQQLRGLVDRCAQHEARAAADALRHEVLYGRPSAPLRDEAVQLMRQVYLNDNDQHALFELCGDSAAAPGWAGLGGRLSAD